jgi:hypothetical protein
MAWIIIVLNILWVNPDNSLEARKFEFLVSDNSSFQSKVVVCSMVASLYEKEAESNGKKIILNVCDLRYNT